MLRQKNGPVAQLGARINRTDEVAGSNPARSTKESTQMGGFFYHSIHRLYTI